MSTKFGIDIAIEAKTEAGRRKVEQDLKALETQAKQTGAVIDEALSSGFDEAAMEAVRALKAEQEALKAAEAAMDDFLAAAKETTDALKAQGQQLGDTEEKTKQSTKTWAAQAHEWVKSKSGAMEVVDAVGKVGLAMNTVNQAVQLGQMAWQGFSVAVGVADLALSKVLGRSASPEEWAQVVQSGALRDFGSGVQGFVGDFANERRTWKSFAEDMQWKDEGGWNSVGGFGIDAVFNERITQLQEQAADAVAEQERQLAQELAARTFVIAEGQRKAVEEQLGGHQYDGSVGFWNPQWGPKPRGWGRKPGSGGGGAPTPTEPSAPSMWDDLEGNLSYGGDVVGELAKAAAEYGALRDTAEAFGESMLGVWGEAAGLVEGYADAAEAAAASTETVAEATTDWGKALQQGLAGPVGGAIDGLIDGLTEMEMGWKEWGAAALQEIAKVAARLLLLRGVEAAFGAGGGGNWLGGLLWGALGGGPPGGGAGGAQQRQAPGDPFGGGAGGYAPTITERVAPPMQPGGQGGGQPAAMNLKVINLSDPRQAMFEFLNTAEGERAVVNVVDRNRSSLGMGGR